MAIPYGSSIPKDHDRRALTVRLIAKGWLVGRMLAGRDASSAGVAPRHDGIRHGRGPQHIRDDDVLRHDALECFRPVSIGPGRDDARTSVAPAAWAVGLSGLANTIHVKQFGPLLRLA